MHNLIIQYLPKIFYVLTYMRCSINTHELRSCGVKKYLVLKIKIYRTNLWGKSVNSEAKALRKEEQEVQQRDAFLLWVRRVPSRLS